jgi:hypothetical protein
MPLHQDRDHDTGATDSAAYDDAFLWLLAGKPTQNAMISMKVRRRISGILENHW